MRLEDLKKGLWGYKKDSVYQYVANMEEELSAKLLEKDKQLTKTIEDVRQEAAKAVAQTKEDMEGVRREAALAAEQVKKDADDLVERTKLESAQEVEQAQLRSEEVQKAAKQTQAELERALRRISELEVSLQASEAENRVLRQESQKISAAILDAQRYAQQMRDETEAQEQRTRADLQAQADRQSQELRMQADRQSQELQAQVDRQRQELQEYAGKIMQLKRSLNALLLEIGSRADAMESECSDLEDHTPVVKLVAFPPAAGAPFPPKINHGDSHHMDSGIQ